ncbi:hypothetical protein HO133_007978 [Letharia lupina]|uniref:FAD-binding PCMH-type domain-containing protein n=1 Tax=Letharia lupina TaxID=560253 RepID=A0A8H6CRH4_9LECA|nr:uncharacterized protein HO133_007978 [Letharia lupina]KAF6228248.1 hypothetical protein HO133_007978 [Letharia lupina]
MALSRFIIELRINLSPEARVYTDASSKDFQLALLRWSDVDVKVPGAIIQVANELDAVTTASSTPFAEKVLLWSTIGTDGFVLDFTIFKSIQVNSTEHQVAVAGGVLMKELSTVLADAGECAAVGNANTIGVIPYCLGGGLGVATGLMGLACDNMLSAKVILADGRLVYVDNVHEPDLFWAIKGAGFYFGAVIEITLRTYPLTIFGTHDGRHWIGNFMYPLERAAEVFEVIETLVNTPKSRTACLLMIIAPPPYFQPTIAVVPHYFGDLTEGPKIFQCLTDLGPSFFSETTPLVPNLSDHLDFACGKGGFRRFTLAGLQELKAANILKLADLFQQLLDSCPDAASSGYFIEWHCLPPPDIPTNSAFSHHDVRIWIHCLSWCQRQENWDKVFGFEQRAIDTMRFGTKPETHVDLPHGTRTGPIEQRFKGQGRLTKLRALKKEFDPQGAFTKEFL